jgi:hypothetical protein
MQSKRRGSQRPVRPISTIPEVERRRMVTVPDAASFKCISVDGFKRHYGHLIRQITPRRQGVQLGDLLD